MADDKDQNDRDDFEDLDEEFDLDLFADEDAQSAADGRIDPRLVDQQSSPAEQEIDEEFEREFAIETIADPEDEFADTLDDDVIDISDEEVAEEFAAMEQEDIVATPTPQPPAEASTTVPTEEVDNKSDELYQDFTNEEFAAPDQYSSESRAMGKTEKSEADAETEAPRAMALPPFLASLASLSPRMIVAATAAVLVPVVIFTVLGFNTDSSDAEENGNADAGTIAQEATADPFADGNAQTAPADEQVNVPGLTAEDIEPALAATRNAAPQADIADAPTEVHDSEEAGAKLAATSNTETVDPEPAPPSESQILLAQNDTQQEPRSDTPQSSEPETQETEEEPAAATTAPPETVAQEAEVSSTEVARAQLPATDADLDVPGTDEGRNYHVIVASFASASVARQHAESISDNEISAYVIAPFGGSDNYRVAVANYRSMAEARENIPGLQAIYGEGIWPLRYPPSPGVPLISQRNGNTYIIVASFPNEELARTHARGLVERGEQPAIIAPYPPANRYRVAVSYYDSTSNAESALTQFRENYGEDAWLLRY